MQSPKAFTVDVEDYFHVSAFAKDIDPEQWDALPSRVESNTHRVLNLLDEHGHTATFFVLGWVAERYPALVREIAQRGHEVACHGYSHQLIFKQERQEFSDETLRAKSLLEDTVQTEVAGYRAASFSITKASLWAIDTLAEVGFRYDSSIYPVRHDVYGMQGTPLAPYILSGPDGGKLVEFPLSTASLLGVNLPASGGGYFRLFPYAMSRHLIERVHREQRPYVFYMHPWEIDVEQPRIESHSFLSRFRHYNNIHRCEARLQRLLSEHSFDSMARVLEQQSLLHLSSPPLSHSA